jgi:hypothetical protein
MSGLGLFALLGLVVFGLLAWRSVTVEQTEPDLALSRFGRVRDVFSGTEPILRVSADGRVVRRANPDNGTASAKRLHVLAYQHAEHRLVRADVSFWFLKAKGPAVQYSLRGTGLDLKQLGVTPADLQQYGPCLILDETRTNGDRLLVWTE